MYGEFLTQVAESQHNSCLLLVSNEKPKDLAIRECASAAVRSLQLKGLDRAARYILEDKELSEEERWDDLIEAYRGHPLALKIVATTIKELFDGNVSEFLSQNTLFLGDLAFILHQEYQRLSDLEKKIICMIVDSDRPIALVQIKKQFNKKIRSSDLMSCLDILKRRSLVEINRVKNSTLYTPGYMPPEQIDGVALPQSDFFALGRTFINLLTGKHPQELPKNPDTGQLIWRESAPHITESLLAIVLTKKPLRKKPYPYVIMYLASTAIPSIMAVTGTL